MRLRVNLLDVENAKEEVLLHVVESDCDAGDHGDVGDYLDLVELPLTLMMATSKVVSLGAEKLKACVRKSKRKGRI